VGQVVRLQGWGGPNDRIDGDIMKQIVYELHDEPTAGHTETGIKGVGPLNQNIIAECQVGNRALGFAATEHYRHKIK
jgi:hypothetical protein